MGTSLIKS